MIQRLAYTFLLILVMQDTLLGQIQGAQTPQFGGVSPLKPGKSQPTQYKQQANQHQNTQYRAALQMTNADAIEQNYKAIGTPDAIFKAMHETNEPLTASSFVPHKQKSSVDIVHAVLNEVNRRERAISYKLPSKLGQEGASYFTKAKKELLDMLEGRKPLDLKQAVFITENAFFGNEMNYEDYQKSIDEMVLLIGLKMQQEGLPLHNNQAINYMAHKYMSDTLDIKLHTLERTATTFPKRYDFKDPFGHENPTNLFVSKLIMNNSGQCKSLPLLYLILVEAMGGNAYLSFSPSHSFIKCKDKNGTWYNIELTNGMLTSDSWVIGSGYVKAEAIKSGIFLDTLTKKQVIANCLVDLGQYYSWRYNGYDDFVLQCANKALEYHPSNIWAIQVKSDYYTLLFKYVTAQLGYTTKEDLEKDPKALELFLQRNRMYALVDGLGYETMPEKAYLDWLQTLEDKQQQQQHEEQLGNFSKFVR